MESTQTIILALDSGALIQSEKNPRIEAVIRKWIAEGAELIIPAPCLAESVRGTARDAPVHRLVAAVKAVLPLTGPIARAAGALLGETGGKNTIDAMIVATARAYGATDILTSDPVDIERLAGASMNVLSI